ncbi:hypothetical protein [Sutcliffiella horikoshii]|uniref:hypothetical protein n=1 Tax=Sutcliffiella horikoshii TaxID=79883 RepID=UPI001F342196|nr:hypothetical protein [Sutcliffiella horikoshii]
MIGVIGRFSGFSGGFWDLPAIPENFRSIFCVYGRLFENTGENQKIQAIRKI